MARRRHLEQRALAASAFLAASLPGIARANDMSGLALVVAAIFVGAPIAVVLIASIVASLIMGRKVASWHRVYATVTTILAVLLAFAFPCAVVLLGGDKFVGLALVVDVPVLVLASFAVVLARGMRKRSLTGPP